MILGVLAMGLCSAALAQPSTPPVATHAHIAYGPHERQTLDLYLVPGDRPHGMAIFIHGGAFLKGDKSGVNPAALARLLEASVHVASINYRYSSQAPYPAPMHDEAQALQFLRLHAEAYRIQPDQIAAWGESAGGGIALWLALHADLAQLDNPDPLRHQSTRLVAAAAILAQTTYDPFVTNAMFPGIRAEASPMYLKLFGILDAEAMRRLGSQAVFDDASPIRHLTPDDPPLHLVYKDDVAEVPADAPLNTWVHHRRHGDMLEAAGRGAGVPITLQIKGGFHPRPRAGGSGRLHRVPDPAVGARPLRGGHPVGPSPAYT